MRLAWSEGMRSIAGTGVILGFALASGCANDPVYLPGEMTMEAGVADDMGMLSEAKASLQLPIKLESADDMASRAALQTELDPIQVPYVRVGDLEVEVEWTIKNLDAKDGQATIQLNGANEYFAYDPSVLMLAADEDEEAPPAPPLAGDIPLTIPANGSIQGIFTEDEVREASIDLDQITRANVNPFRATLTVSKNAASFQPLTPPMPDVMDYVQTPVGDPIPREAFAQMVRIDLVFKPNMHMVLEYNVRVRDKRGILHDLLLTAVTDKPDELQTFAPAVYNPTAATP